MTITQRITLVTPGVNILREKTRDFRPYHHRKRTGSLFFKLTYLQLPSTDPESLYPGHQISYDVLNLRGDVDDVLSSRPQTGQGNPLDW